MKEIDFIEHMLRELMEFVQEKHGLRENVGVTSKSEANDLVTEVDLAVQDRLVEAITKTFPGDAIAAEERGFYRVPDDPEARCWVIDPIDGTQNFVRGLFPAFGISVAFAQGGRSVAGGVGIPRITESGDVGFFLAEKGGGAFLNGKRLRVSDVDSVSVSRIEVDFSSRRHRDEVLNQFGEVLRQSGQIRCNCAAAMGLCSVASAEMDAFLHVTLHPWDYAASQVIVEEAGGRASRLDGSPLCLFDKRLGVLVSNGRVHDEILSLLGQ